MIQLTLLDVSGFEAAFKAMRLPKRSEGDSQWYDPVHKNPKGLLHCTFNGYEAYSVGPKDLALAQKLILAGDEHAKCMRGIEAWIEIDMPLYFMIELDTYRIGCDVLSTSSSMHTDLKSLKEPALSQAKGEITGDYRYTRIFKITYQSLRRLYFQRRKHRLDDWKYFCKWIEDTLPMAKELITLEG